MLTKADHGSWFDPELEARLCELLDKSRDTCAMVIQMIEECLGELESESRKLETSAHPTTGSSEYPLESKLRRPKIAKKLSFTFSGPRLEKNLTVLESLNSNFRTLSSQTMRLSNSHHHKQLSPSQKSCQEVERYKVIRQASQQVYESLGKACTKHKEHQAHFCVEAKQVENGGEDCFQIRFNMAYTQRPGAPNQSELIWFVVGSTSGYIEKQGSSVLNTLSKDSIENSLKRQPDSMACTVQKKIRKSVRFQSPVRIPSYTPPIPSVAMASVYERIQKDFCDHLRRLRDRPQASECVGVLGNSANCKNLVYTYPIEQCHSHRQPFTLEQLISTGGQVRSNGRILLEDRVRLAKTLAVAVLQYYSTPWLKKSWRSEDIYFFTSSLTLPHLNVRVKGPCDQLSQAPMTPPHSLARNPLLFSLAVVLLEIAYKSKLDNLQSPVDLVDGPGYTEFFVARRLATSAETDMPGKYHKIVERLIECDFACGSDMEDPKLQAAFHNDVICPLEELEQGLHRLYLD